MKRQHKGAVRATRGVMGGLMVLGLGACVDRTVAKVTPVTQNGVSELVSNEGTNQVDLVVMVDNSGSMAQNQLNILAQLGPLINRLVSPPCVLHGDTTGATVACSTPGAAPQYPAIEDLHVAVVSSDLGAPAPVGAPRVPGCLGDMGNDVFGDDGLFDPIANGAGEASHLPWTYIVNEYGGPLPDQVSANLASCSRTRTDANAYPPFLSFCSSTAGAGCVGEHDAAAFTAQFRCNAALSTGGCGLESQLESPFRALTVRSGVGQPNDGFLRDNALLALVVLTDEEDGSVRDDARSVYDSRSMDWAPTTNLNQRFYLYDAPGASGDPTWNPDRYVNPRDPSAGFLALKPGHPERIIFAAIAGAPLTIPLRPDSTPASESIDWDALLGPPGVNGPDDWYGRHHDQALRMDTPQGPISMRHNDRDTACPTRSSGTVPACYREGQPQSCDTYFAAPSRRVIEVARRFDQSPLCGGQPCHNGLVRSICASDFTSAMDDIIRRIQSRIVAPCLPRRLNYETTVVLDQSTQQPLLDANGQPASGQTVSCSILETRPAGDDACPLEAGRVNPHSNALDSSSPRTVQYSTLPDSMGRRLCEVLQAPLQGDPATAASMPLHPFAGQLGWYYDTSVDNSNPTCTQRISYTANASPPTGSLTELQCIQRVSGSATGLDAGSGG